MAISPPLKTNNMKLYTEEQVREMLNGLIGARNVNDFLHRYYTPIELPNDEEIDIYVKSHKYDDIFENLIQNGARWMRNKILNK